MEEKKKTVDKSKKSKMMWLCIFLRRVYEDRGKSVIGQSYDVLSEFLTVLFLLVCLCVPLE